MRRRALPWIAAVLALGTQARDAAALEVGRHRLDPGGKVRAARSVDLDGDGRLDLVLLLEPREGKTASVLLLRTPTTPDPKTFFRAEDRTVIRCEGALAEAGAVAVGRFGLRGEVRLRFFGADGAVDLKPDGAPDPEIQREAPVPRTLLGRSPGQPLVLWEGVAELGGGRDACLVPVPDGGGRVRLVGLAGHDLEVSAHSMASSSAEDLLTRTVYLPTLVPADLDGNGVRELVSLQGATLVVHELAPRSAAGSRRIPLPFLEPPKELAPEEVRTPRLQLLDVDRDGTTDLIVTLVSGRRDQLGSLRTTLWFVRGPILDVPTGTVRTPESRVDTESVALHPRFLDLDGDGDLDYVGDSIRGTRGDLVKRVLGAEPKITLVGFLYDRAAARFGPEPCFAVERPYATDQALSNTFGQSAWFDGDFDGDGWSDLLDLGNLTGVELFGARRRAAGAAGDLVSFAEPLLPRLAVEKGLQPAAVVADLNADGRADAALWNDHELFLLVSKGAR
jgi:hypothetical protein